MKPHSQQVIYKSLGQVLRALNQNKDVPEVKCVLNLCKDIEIVSPKEGSKSRERNRIGGGCPFVVVEGLDGTGKTTLTRSLSKKLQMKLMCTPPKNNEEFIKVRDYFDAQKEPLRRAWYSLGNYLAANEVLKSEQPVVMDRFWHSTAAYSLGYLKKSGGTIEKSSFEWPEDLLQPDLVIFLQVSEKERLRRHASRKAFTNTAEEQTLAEDQAFRENIHQYYRSVVGPPFQELIIDGEQPESEARILNTVLNAFPNLDSFVRDSSQSL